MSPTEEKNTLFLSEKRSFINPLFLRLKLRQLKNTSSCLQVGKRSEKVAEWGFFPPVLYKNMSVLVFFVFSISQSHFLKLRLRSVRQIKSLCLLVFLNKSRDLRGLEKSRRQTVK